MNGQRTSFDQRNEQIGIATPRGFIIYECTSYKVLYEAVFPGGGANCISLLSDSNLVAASGDDSLNGFSKKSVILWDCKFNKAARLWDVENPIQNIFFRSDCLVVVHGNQITFYDCCDFGLIYSTVNPQKGHFCVALAQSSNINLVAFPSPSGDCLYLADYHDPEFSLGKIPIPFNLVNFFAFDKKGELLAIVVDDARIIQLWSVMELKLIAKFKRGMRSTEVNGIAFDNLSNYFIMTTKRGTMHVFAIPTPAERRTLDTSKSIRSKFSFELPKGTNFHCQFDIAGYVISGITDDGQFKQVRLDIESGNVVSICDMVLEM